ncbi:MAG TPA: bifunctional NADP-dependent methylenetetrahydromethanopterin dehydrogenase/methylenetetrahydrofolate dehydrogenase, partial [Pirellulales bacterium]|nr:bifunctional NADP-dependent methylenetetrahydromethanopterin dehydrogenase/methylenetetrahydrofolate dehydrogenase [Pirellulales bacterium]
AESVCEAARSAVPEARLSPCAPQTAEQLEHALDGVQVLIAAGAPGIELLPAEVRQRARGLQVAIDLNAVPPAGLEGIEVIDRATDRGGVKCYGAIGVGGTKMRIHKAALQLMFETNDRVLDVEELFELGRGV